MSGDVPQASGSNNFYADKSDIEVARHINLALLMCKGISDEDAGFDTVTTLNDAGLAAVANIIGKVRIAAIAAAPSDLEITQTEIMAIGDTVTTLRKMGHSSGDAVAWLITWPDGGTGFTSKDPGETFEGLDILITPLYAAPVACNLPLEEFSFASEEVYEIKSDLIARLKWLASPDAERISDYQRINKFVAAAWDAVSEIERLRAAPVLPSSEETREAPVDITGWKLVPDQPTEEMWQAGRSADIHPGDSYSKVWSAMFEAAPNVDDCETFSEEAARAFARLFPDYKRAGFTGGQAADYKILKRALMGGAGASPRSRL